MRQQEMRVRELHIDQIADAYRTAWISGLLSGLLGITLTVVVGVLVRRSSIARARQQWLQSGQAGLAIAIQGDKSTDELGHGVLTFLGDYLGAQAAALFSGDGQRFQRNAVLGVPADAKIIDSFSLKEGLLGQVAASRSPTVIRDVPDGYLTIGSALGRDKPKHLVIFPIQADDIVNGVIELGFLHSVEPATLELLQRASNAVGIAVRSARYRTELTDLLEETQRQSEELQVQSEELRVSNEELEEQSRALKESQVRLEQTNSQLEKQTQLLELQKSGLEQANSFAELKARELEQASRHKSDFLANMSHELRTPLNSLLILSKLLGDNPEGNLFEEQIKFARTIESSGNDLLTLINDILDLSKIEAGHLQIQPETVPIARLASDLDRTFQPVAGDRRLKFEIDVADDCPAAITSDRQRLEQILKNLLSNAFKFTEAGAVKVTIRPAGAGRIAFAVTDSGIGIAEDQQSHIFEAFHQADGAISRKFGGTGLGLSISRQLARMLGGSIALDSKPGHGSTFTLTVPAAYDPALIAAREDRPTAVAHRPASDSVPPIAAPQKVDDDRDQLTAGRRILLVIEDDDSFAEIVRDLSRNIGFQCLVAGTAEEALRLARQFKPNAIVLDVGLPDQSGLTVLDQLKRDDRTRHIPVHVASGADHTRTAFALGAVGYLLKPVKRDDLAEALQTLESKLTRTMRRVLIVEDDPVQRDALGQLLASSDVETIGVSTAAECLERLKEQTFDCMVLDLSLPDASGFTLLKTLSAKKGHAFPPVIVYTGRDLSADDEQRLRRYSSSIIIKGAKSPERLLDEVSLFLHQVVSELPPEHQQMIRKARDRDAALEGRRILVVEDDIRNIYSLSSILEPHGAMIEIARNGQEAIETLEASSREPTKAIDLVLMDVMMPIKDGLTATSEIRSDPRWRTLPIIALTAKAMPDDQERCMKAGANDYMAKPIDVDKLLSLVRVWMPR
jgi:CheY-like chemotaxis protein